MTTSFGSATSAPATLARSLALAAGLLLAALGLTGCSTTQDAHYNRWDATHGRPGLLRRVERAPDALTEALANFDERVENAAY